jgi:2,5-dihydroxypyridine 5,6-dioxygenase
MANRRIMMSSTAVPELIGLYKHQLRMSNLKPGETCLVITDMAFNPVYADACFGAASELGAEVVKLTLPFIKPIPEQALGAAMLEADLIVYSTTHKLHYSEKMRQALNKGARSLMVVQPLQTMQRLHGDPDVIRRTKAGASLLKKANTIRIVSEAGTDLTMKRGDRPALAHYGVADEPEHLDFWGVGIVETAPLEGTLEGTMVLDVGDQMFYMNRYTESPVKISFKKGRIQRIDGGLDALLIRQNIESYQEESAWMAGHISWGTDKRALWAAQTLQFPEPGYSGADAESYYGNVQIEIGSNNDVNFCGNNISQAHLGHCMLNCSLYLDDLLIIEKGKFTIEELI